MTLSSGSSLVLPLDSYFFPSGVNSTSQEIFLTLLEDAI